MEYKYLGHETAGTVKPLADSGYRLDSLNDLFDVLSDGIWRVETCTPRMRDDWSESNKTLGHAPLRRSSCRIFSGARYTGY